MERYEMAEMLKNKAQVTYEEARQALEKSGWDMLQAMVELEKAGKIRHSAGPQAGPRQAPKARPQAEGALNKALSWLAGLIDKGNQHRFIIEKDGGQTSSISVTVLVVLFLLFHGLAIFLLLLGLVLGYRYRFVSAAQQQEAQSAAREAEHAARDLEDRQAVNSLGENPVG